MEQFAHLAELQVSQLKDLRVSAVEALTQLCSHFGETSTDGAEDRERPLVEVARFLEDLVAMRKEVAKALAKVEQQRRRSLAPGGARAPPASLLTGAAAAPLGAGIDAVEFARELQRKRASLSRAAGRGPGVANGDVGNGPAGDKFKIPEKPPRAQQSSAGSGEMDELIETLRSGAAFESRGHGARGRSPNRNAGAGLSISRERSMESLTEDC